MSLVSQLHCLEDQLAAGGCENVANSLDVQHACTNIACLCRLMAGTTVGDDGNTISILQILADDQMAIYIQNVRECQAQAYQLFISDGFGSVHKLLHPIGVPP